MASSTDAMFGEILRAMVREEVSAALESREKGASGGDQGAASRPPNSKTPPAGLDPFALAPFAEYVLREAGGGPLRASVIAERMYEKGFRHRHPPKHRDQLTRSVNSLASPSQRPDLFKREGPRTLRLA